MIATERFVFLHLHKSGGTFVNNWLLRFFPGARPVGYHLPRRMIPAPLAALPMLGTVRNPWSYYVSWYAFQAARPQPNPLFAVLSEGGTLGFAETIRNMLALGSGGERLDAAIAALPAGFTGRGLNLPGPALAAIRDSGLGFYSFLYRYLYGDDEAVAVAPMESMRRELIPLIEATGAEVSAAARDHLTSAPPSNASDHRAAADYYDAELAALVAQRDGALIERFGYRLGD